MSFLQYLDEFEKKFETKIVEQRVVEEVVREQPKKVIAKKVITIIKKPIKVHKEPIQEHLSRATNILDGIDDYGYSPGTPSNLRFYDETGISSKQNGNAKLAKEVSSRANDILNDEYDSDSGSYGHGGMPMPLMDVPQMDEELMRFVPKEMMSEQHLQQVQKIENNNVPKEEVQMSPEMIQMMKDTEEMQKMFSQNIDMSDIPHEFLPR